MRKRGSEHFPKGHTQYPCPFPAPGHTANPLASQQRPSARGVGMGGGEEASFSASYNNTLWASSGPVSLLLQQRQAPLGATPTPQVQGEVWGLTKSYLASQ